VRQANANRARSHLVFQLANHKLIDSLKRSAPNEDQKHKSNHLLFPAPIINYFGSSEDWRSDLPFLPYCFLRAAYNHRRLIRPPARCGVCENCRLRSGRESSIIRHAAFALSKNYLIRVFIPAYHEERFIGPAPRMKPNILLNHFKAQWRHVREDDLLKLEESHSSLVGLRTVTLGLLAVTLCLLSDSNF